MLASLLPRVPMALALGAPPPCAAATRKGGVALPFLAGETRRTAGLGG